MAHNLKLVQLNADQYYWHTEQRTDDGGFAIFDGDKLIYADTDEIEANLQYEWELYGGSELVNGELVEKKGVA